MPKRSELKITKRAVDALSVEAGDALFWDRGLAGFGVRVHATGGKVYVAQSRGPGGPKRVTLGRHGEMSADESMSTPHLLTVVNLDQCGRSDPTDEGGFVATDEGAETL